MTSARTEQYSTSLESDTANRDSQHNPNKRISADEFRSLLEDEFGIDGVTPDERLEQFRQLSVEGAAIFLEEINKAMTASTSSNIVHDRAVRIGTKSTIPPEDRYEVFTHLIESIKKSSGVATDRIADVLALGVVLLHPFSDGNGRTARTIGLIFRDEYDDVDYENTFDIATESRDIKRASGGFMINGYIPHIDGDRSDARTVIEYLDKLLEDDAPYAYTSCFGQAPLRKNVVEDSSEEQEQRKQKDAYENYAAFS